MRNLWWIRCSLIGVFIFLSFFACRQKKSSSSSDEASLAGEREITVTASPTGGSYQLTLSDGKFATLTIPEGALSEETAITMSTGTSEVFDSLGLPENLVFSAEDVEASLSSYVKLLPHGITFNKPVTLTVDDPNFGSTTHATEFYRLADEDSESWERLASFANAEEGKRTLLLTGFSYYESVTVKATYSQTPLTVDEFSSTEGNLLVNSSNYFSCGLKEGSLYCWGDYTFAQSPKPVTKIDQENGWTHLATGKLHVCGIKAGQAYCWGTGSYGELGNGSTSNKQSPTAVVNPDNGSASWTAISAGSNQSCGIYNNKAYCWGFKLGQGVQAEPLEVSTTDAEPWTMISIGGNHSCGIRNKKAYCWGGNTYGQLGVKSPDVSFTPLEIPDFSWKVISAGYLRTCGITEDDKTYCWGQNINSCGTGSLATCGQPFLIEGRQFSSVSVGDTHFCGIEDGKAYCWGENILGAVGGSARIASFVSQPTLVEDSTGWSSISAGSHATCGVKNNQAYCWGSNRSGNLGHTMLDVNGCAAGPTVTNGTLAKTTGGGSCEKVPVDESCTLTCSTGYTASGGNTTTTCTGALGQESWDTELSCVKVCASAPSVSNGSFKTTSDGTCENIAAGSTCSLTCDSGYSPSSTDATTTCGTDGNWSNTTLSCNPTQCTAAPTLAGATFTKTGSSNSCNNVAIGGTCTFSCNDGYTKSAGTDSVTCGTDRTWSTPSASCTRTSKYIYLTSAKTTGNRGGVSGADTFCTNNAPAGLGITSAKALIVGTNRTACTTANCSGGTGEHVNWVLQPSTSYLLAGATTKAVTTNSKGLFDFPLPTAFSSTSGSAWTGLNTDYTSYAETCASWAVGQNYIRGSTGDITSTSNTSMAASTSETCEKEHYLYCVEQ